MSSKSKVYIRNDQTIVKREAKRWLVVTLKDGRITSFDATAKFVWDALDGRRTSEQIVSLLARKTRGDKKRVREDIDALIAEFCAVGLARLTG